MICCSAFWQNRKQFPSFCEIWQSREYRVLRFGQSGRVNLGKCEQGKQLALLHLIEGCAVSICLLQYTFDAGQRRQMIALSYCCNDGFYKEICLRSTRPWCIFISGLQDLTVLDIERSSNMNLVLCV